MSLCHISTITLSRNIIINSLTDECHPFIFPGLYISCLGFISCRIGKSIQFLVSIDQEKQEEFKSA